MSERVGEGLVAMVTGAGSGVGEEVVYQLAKLGYNLVLIGRTAEKLERVGDGVDAIGGDEGVRWMTVVGDVGIGDDRARMVEEAMGVFGRVDVLVNNAGVAIFEKMGSMGIDALEGMFAVNAVGPVDLARRVVGGMAARGSGVIVNVSSMAQIDPFDGLGVYGCTKGAVGVLAKAIANEYGEAGVRGYSICPGAIETGMLRSFVSEEFLPTSATMRPGEVAEAIVGCVTGESGRENGDVFEMVGG